jgi:hypothetical protein
MWVGASAPTCGLKPAPTCSGKKPAPEEHATISSIAVIGFSLCFFDPDSDTDPDPDVSADSAKFFLIFTKSSPILLS